MLIDDDYTEMQGQSLSSLKRPKGKQQQQMEDSAANKGDDLMIKSRAIYQSMD